ncbi:MAG: Mpo1-like protein [Thermoanaerobaculia bacterium]
MQIESFADFWPYYVRQHSQPLTRILHAAGSVLAVAMVGLAFAINLWLLLAVPVVGYAFAWYAHFFVERNRPATFGHPLYSLLADYRMVFLMMAGRMDAEVTKATRAVSGPASPADFPVT